MVPIGWLLLNPLHTGLLLTQDPEAFLQIFIFFAENKAFYTFSNPKFDFAVQGTVAKLFKAQRD